MRKAICCGIALAILIPLFPLILGYAWWQATRDFGIPGIIMLIIFGALPEWIKYLIEHNMPDVSEEARMAIFRPLKYFFTFLYVIMAFVIFLLALQFTLMAGLAGLVIWFGFLFLLLLPVCFFVLMYRGMRTRLLAAISLGMLYGLGLIFYIISLETHEVISLLNP